jgi:predicted ArsR family transcriptional regulator
VQKALKPAAPWLVNDYLDSITESLGSSDQSRYRRLLAALNLTPKPVSFADLARQLPDPPKQIARDVFDLAERHFVHLEASDPDATQVEITDAGRKALTSG